mgnify:CR=1 FL=1
MNLSVRILGKNQIACRGGGIVASRDALGDRHANCLVGKPKEFGPLAYARTGARRSARLRLHGAIEFANIEREVIDELALPHSNFKGCICKGGMGAVGCQSRRLQLESEISAQLIEGPF